jgi:hypothetical protein
MSTLMPGSRLGPYEILALVGAGGMGQVWKARDTRLDRIVAIKVAQEKFSTRFEREARTVASLKSAAGGGTEQPVMVETAARAAGIESSTVVPNDWSADGQHVIFSVPVKSPGYDLWLLPLAGDRKPVAFMRSPGAMHANFSRDGRLVAYTSNESGRLEVYVQTVPLSDRKWQVSIGGGYEPRWGRDVNELYYLSEDRKLMAVSVGTGPSFGAPKPLFQTGVPPGVTSFRTNYVPTRDGQRFLIKTQMSEPALNPITVVLNWTARFKK